MTEQHGILFDKDGTLIDFNATWLPLYTEAANLIEFTFQRTGLSSKLLNAGGYDSGTGCWVANSILASGSNLDIMEFWETESGSAFDSALKKQLSDLFTGEKVAHVSIIDDIGHFMDQLKAKHYCLGVATMDDEASARATLTKLGILDQMDFVCGADSGFGVKPNAGMLSAFCKQNQLSPANVFMVGDSPRDLQMVKNLGSGTAVGVLSGASRRVDLEVDADIIINDISELLELLEDLRHKN